MAPLTITFTPFRPFSHERTVLVSHGHLHPSQKWDLQGCSRTHKDVLYLKIHDSNFSFKICWLFENPQRFDFRFQNFLGIPQIIGINSNSHFFHHKFYSKTNEIVIRLYDFKTNESHWLLKYTSFSTALLLFQAATTICALFFSYITSPCDQVTEWLKLNCFRHFFTFHRLKFRYVCQHSGQI